MVPLVGPDDPERAITLLRRVPMWLVCGVVGLGVLLTRWLPLHSGHGVIGAEEVGSRAWPILTFLVAVTVLAELADSAGVFEAAAAVCARIGRGSVPALFALMALLGTLTTIVLSLDTTAVLLTPVVLTLARRLELQPLPFALLAVWLANTASLLLPVSNLTNLLAANRLDLPATQFASTMLLPEVAAVLASVLVLGLWFRRDLGGRYDVPALPRPDDMVLFVLAAGCCVLLAPFVVAGVAPYLVATPAAVVLTIAYAVRRRRAALSIHLLPWRLVVVTMGLFLTVTAASDHFLRRLLVVVLGAGTGGTDLGVFRTAGVSAVASNALNNLPAYLALEQAVPPNHGSSSTTALLAVLLGTNTGPLVLLWGSLATLLWRERCRAQGVVISPWQFAKVGLVGTPVVLLASAAALLVTR